jgi:hypothetical protein
MNITEYQPRKFVENEFFPASPFFLLFLKHPSVFQFHYFAMTFSQVWISPTG